MPESEPLDLAVILGQHFRVIIEETVRHEGLVNAALLIQTFDEEWAEYMRGDEPNEDDVYEFVKEMAYRLGAEEILLLEAPWATEVRSGDKETDVEVRP